MSEFVLWKIFIYQKFKFFSSKYLKSWMSARISKTWHVHISISYVSSALLLVLGTKAHSAILFWKFFHTSNFYCCAEILKWRRIVIEYWLHCEKVLSNSADSVNNLQNGHLGQEQTRLRDFFLNLALVICVYFPIQNRNVRNQNTRRLKSEKKKRFWQDVWFIFLGKVLYFYLLNNMTNKRIYLP